MTMFFKKCNLKQALETDRYVRGLLTEAEKNMFEKKLKLSKTLQKEVFFSRQLMLYYQRQRKEKPKPTG